MARATPADDGRSQDRRRERRQERVAGAGRVDLAVGRGRQVAQRLGGPSVADLDQQPALVALRDEQVGARVEEAGRASASGVSASTSWWLTPTRSARRDERRRPRRPARRPARPATRSRRNPCQPTATSAPSGMTAAQSSSTSPATGTSDQPGAARHDSGRAGDRQRHADRVTHVWTRPVGRLAVVEDRAFVERHEPEVDARPRAAGRARAPWPRSRRRR